jgi:hypothetical protein
LNASSPYAALSRITSAFFWKVPSCTKSNPARALQQQQQQQQRPVRKTKACNDMWRHGYNLLGGALPREPCSTAVGVAF